MTTDLVVDLSNVCRDPSLGRSDRPADWTRWIRLQSALRQHLGQPISAFLVADGNLRRLMSRGDQIRFDREHENGNLITSSVADQTLLEAALDRNGHVVSNDKFTDYMRLPGILKLPILRWQAVELEIRVHDAFLQMPHSVEITRRQEQEEKKRRWADTVHLNRKWLCANVACEEEIVLVPDLKPGAASCPICGAYLQDLGPYSDAVMIKILVDGRETNRLTLESGQSVTIGRAESTVDLTPALDADQVRRISRQHLRITNAEGVVTAEDLGSSNGSELLKPAGKLGVRMWRPGTRMKSGEPRSMDPGSRVRLARIPVVVEVSGRSFGRGRNS